jgi:hypothetical protein
VDVHDGPDQRCGPGLGQGQRPGGDTKPLAQVIMIRQHDAGAEPRVGLLGSLVTKAWGFASPRTQATSVRPTPRPPSSPAPRSVPRSTPSPNDAA